MVNLTTARDYIYRNGVLWERALFAYLFESGTRDHLYDCLRAYKNPDAGYGHGLEADARTPSSHPLALEYLLSTLTFFDLPADDLLDGTPQWLEAVQQEDGSLTQPEDIRDYPLAPWWQETGGQDRPTSIVGNLIKYDHATPTLTSRTRAWVTEHLTLKDIENTDWLFMNYHAFDYFMNVNDFPGVERYRKATISNIVRCAKDAADAQLPDIFAYVPSPAAPAAEDIPSHLIEKALDVIVDTQTEEGYWRDQHDLTQWFAITTIKHLVILRRFGRLDTAYGEGKSDS